MNEYNYPMLNGERIRLDPLDSQDIPTYLKWLNDIDIIRFTGHHRPLTKEEEEEWFTDLKKKVNGYRFAIIVKEEEKLIGNCGFDVDWKNRVGHLGIMIGEKDYHSKGYGTEALKLLVNHAFNELNLNRMELNVYSFNPRAQKCYQKVGFKEEGRRRQAIYSLGKYHDDIVMGILKEEWKG
jgi:RimJ/RimL family protein N-acetyltransferase